MRACDFVQRDGYFHPVYLSLIARATVSRHNGTPILESFNGRYWSTHRFLSRAEVILYLGEGYVRNMKEKATSRGYDHDL
jgi:hypothetical protein